MAKNLWISFPQIKGTIQNSFVLFSDESLNYSIKLHYASNVGNKMNGLQFKLLFLLTFSNKDLLMEKPICRT